MARARTVIVAGSVNMDIVGRADRYPALGETVAGRSVAYFPGGKGANQAVAAAKMGARTRFVGRVGDDEFGRRLRAFLRRQRIDLRGFAVSRGAATGVALIVLAGADNAITVIPGANGRLATRDVAALAVAASDILVSQFEIPLATVRAFLARGKRRGAATILNPAPARRVGRAFLRLADIVVLNESELALVSRRRIGPATSVAAIAAAAARLRSRPEQAIVVTLGARGVVALLGRKTLIVPARRVRAVDTTGAGDCFVGTLAASLAAGAAIDAAIVAANDAAAISVQRHGAAPSMPTRRELAMFRRESKPFRARTAPL
jgi:ribokinase